ncbi:N-acetylneuraminate synthase family protein [Kribbella sp. NBC_01510]
MGIGAAIAAVALGATVIEKHITSSARPQTGRTERPPLPPLDGSRGGSSRGVPKHG